MIRAGRCNQWPQCFLELFLVAVGSILVARAQASAGAAQNRPIVLKTSTLLDGKGHLFRNTIIVVEDGKISRIGGAAPAGAITYDLAGLTVTPGWIDAHSHIYNHFYNGHAVGRGFPRGEPPVQTALAIVENAYLTLMAGFTTIQSPGAPQDQDVRDMIASGVAPGARILTSLLPLREQSGPPEKIRELVRERKQQGADFVKIFTASGGRTMSEEQIQATCGEARAQGLRVLAHAIEASEVKAAVLAGCTSIEHGFRATDELFELMAQRGTYYDPQVQNFILDNKDKYVAAGDLTEEYFAPLEKNTAQGIETFKKALQHKNLKIIYGTDAIEGAHGRNYEEFIARVRVGGQEPMAALVSATSLTAESLGLGDRIGTIAPGMEADIVGFDGNPIQDVTAARRAVFVMQGGRVVENLPRGSKPGGK